MVLQKIQLPGLPQPRSMQKQCGKITPPNLLLKSSYIQNVLNPPPHCNAQDHSKAFRPAHIRMHCHRLVLCRPLFLPSIIQGTKYFTYVDKVWQKFVNISIELLPREVKEYVACLFVCFSVYNQCTKVGPINSIKFLFRSFLSL